MFSTWVKAASCVAGPITDAMLYLNTNFYTNRTQDNYLQKTHSRHSFDWQERISRYPIFRGGERGEIGER